MDFPRKLENVLHRAISTIDDLKWQEAENGASTVISFYDTELKCRLEVVIERPRSDLNDSLHDSDSAQEAVGAIVQACQAARQNFSDLQLAIQGAMPGAANIRWYEQDENQSSVISFYDGHLQADVEAVIEETTLAVLSKDLQSASKTGAVTAGLVSLCQQACHAIETKQQRLFIDLLNDRLKKTSSSVHISAIEPQSDTLGGSSMKKLRMSDGSLRDYPLANDLSVGQWLFDYHKLPRDQRFEPLNAVIQGLNSASVLDIDTISSLMQAIQVAGQYYQCYKVAQKDTASAGFSEVKRLLARAKKAGNDDYLRWMALHAFFDRSLMQGNTHKPRATEHSFVAYFMQALNDLGLNLPELPSIDLAKDYLAPKETADRQAFLQALAKLHPVAAADGSLSSIKRLEQSIARAFFLYSLHKEASFTILGNRSTGLLHASSLASVPPVIDKLSGDAQPTRESFTTEMYQQTEDHSVWQRLEAFFDPKRRSDNTKPGQGNYSFISFLMNQLKSQNLHLTDLKLPELQPGTDYHQSGTKKARVEYIEQLLIAAAAKQPSRSTSRSPLLRTDSRSPCSSEKKASASLTLQPGGSLRREPELDSSFLPPSGLCSPPTPAEQRQA